MTALLLLVSSLLLVSFARADQMILTDIKGRAIEVTLVSADDSKVVAIRKSDRKEFTISSDQLDEATRAAVNAWRKKVGRLPTNSQTFLLPNAKTKTGIINVRFKLPKGNFNTTLVRDDTINIVFDGGTLSLWVQAPGRTKEAQLKFLDEHLANRLRSMQPKEREKYEPLWKIVETSHSDLVGGMVDFARVAEAGRGGGSSYHFVSNEDFFIEASCSYREGALITPKDVESILGTLEVDSKRAQPNKVR